MQITAVRVTPVAVGDPPLRAASGVHAPFALRTIVEVDTDAGVTGVGETYGGEGPRRELEAAARRIVGREVWALTPLRSELLRDSGRPAGWAWEGRGLGGAGLFAAIEVACLDAIGKATGHRVCDLLGGASRERIPFAAYLFYKHDGNDEWGEVLSPDAMIREARRMVELYGFHSLKVKGGVLEPDREIETILALRHVFGADVPLRLDPNAAWSDATAERVAHRLDGALQYLEDPVPGIDRMAAIAVRAPMPLATNMCVTGFGDLPEAIAKRAVAVVLSDHHMWGGMRATVELGRICGIFGLGMSMHSNSHLGISLAAMVHVAAAVPELTYDCDTHYPWQTDEVIVGGKLPIEDGAVAVPAGPGLGIELDRDALARLSEQYRRAGLVVRDDAAEMRKIDQTWTRHVGDW